MLVLELDEDGGCQFSRFLYDLGGVLELLDLESHHGADSVEVDPVVGVQDKLDVGLSADAVHGKRHFDLLFFSAFLDVQVG